MDSFIFFSVILVVLCRHNLYNLSVLSKRKGLNAMTNLQI
jgi:hypothetical protein